MGELPAEDEELQRRLEASEEALRRASDTIASSDHACLLVKILCNVPVYAASQSQRARGWTHPQDLDLLAYAVRCIFEAGLLAWYYLRKSDDDMIARLAEHFMRDEIEIEQGFLALGRDLHLGFREIAKSLGEHRSSCPRAKRPPSMRELAALLGAEAEYSAFFRLYSKLVHPSAYSLFGRTPKPEAGPIRTLFLMNAARYMEELVALFEEVEAAVLQAEHGASVPDSAE